MERDNFEKQLANLLVKADQEKSRPSNKERAWANVQTKRKNRVFWYVAAAVIVLGFSFALLFNREEGIVPIKNEQTVKRTQKEIPVQVETEVEKPVISLKKAPPKANSVQSKVDTLQLFALQEKVVDGVNEQQHAIVNPANAERQPPIAQANQTIEASFTVQFKRGTITTVKAEEILTPTISLKKFRLKRDVTYFANAEEKQPNKLKISFKKEN